MVASRRDLARARPEALTPDLAASLNTLATVTLATVLSEFGRREEALAAAIETVGFYRDLARARPEAFTSYLASSLNNLAVMLSELGRRKEGFTTTQEATDNTSR